MPSPYRVNEPSHHSSHNNEKMTSSAIRIGLRRSLTSDQLEPSLHTSTSTTFNNSLTNECELLSVDRSQLVEAEQQLERQRVELRTQAESIEQEKKELRINQTAFKHSQIEIQDAQLRLDEERCVLQRRERELNDQSRSLESERLRLQVQTEQLNSLSIQLSNDMEAKQREIETIRIEANERLESARNIQQLTHQEKTKLFNDQETLENEKRVIQQRLNARTSEVDAAVRTLEADRALWLKQKQALIDDRALLSTQQNSLNEARATVDRQQAAVRARETSLDNNKLDLEELSATLQRRETRVVEREDRVHQREQTLEKRFAECCEREEICKEREKRLNRNPVSHHISTSSFQSGQTNEHVQNTKELSDAVRRVAELERLLAVSEAKLAQRDKHQMNIAVAPIASNVESSAAAAGGTQSSPLRSVVSEIKMRETELKMKSSRLDEKIAEWKQREMELHERELKLAQLERKKKISAASQQFTPEEVSVLAAKQNQLQRLADEIKTKETNLKDREHELARQLKQLVSERRSVDESRQNAHRLEAQATANREKTHSELRLLMDRQRRETEALRSTQQARNDAQMQLTAIKAEHALLLAEVDRMNADIATKNVEMRTNAAAMSHELNRVNNEVIAHTAAIQRMKPILNQVEMESERQRALAAANDRAKQELELQHKLLEISKRESMHRHSQMYHSELSDDMSSVEPSIDGDESRLWSTATSPRHHEEAKEEMHMT